MRGAGRSRGLWIARREANAQMPIGGRRTGLRDATFGDEDERARGWITGPAAHYPQLRRQWFAKVSASGYRDRSSITRLACRYERSGGDQNEPNYRRE